jgi:DnaK suppressor protein
MATATRGYKDVRPSGRARYGELQHLLRQQHQVLRTGMERLRESTSAQMSDVTDVEEGAEGLAELSVGLAELEISSRTVRGIETALRLLEAGRYGVCSDCAAGIPAARLKAVPFAERCRGCQEHRDGSPKPRSQCSPS